MAPDRLVSRTLLACATGLAAILLAGGRPCLARGHVVLVTPGPGTPLQDAIDAAGAGDVVALAPGTYAEAIVVDKPLALFTTGGAIIDGGCGAPVTITVAADHVDLRRLDVRGAGVTGIDVTQRDHVKIRDCAVTETCGTAGRGIAVAQSTNVKLYRNRVSAFGEAGFHFEGIAVRNAVSVKKNEARGNTQGFVVADSLPGPRSVVLFKNLAPANTMRGIFLHGSDAVKISYNVVTGDPAIPTPVGIELDATSNDNLLRYNESHGNVLDVIDSGTGNCWEDIEHDTGTVVETVCR